MKSRVLIIDHDSTNTRVLANAMQQSSRIENVLIASDAKDALAKAKEAEFIVLNPMPPEMDGVDGVDLLHQLFVRHLRPGVITLSSFYSPEMLCELNELSVVYCMYKPVDVRYLIQQIENWCEGQRPRLGEHKLQTQRRIAEILQELGMTLSSGYYDCCAAIEWLCAHKKSRGRLQKKLYSMIARQTGQSVRQVKRNVRNAIEQTWLSGDPNVLKQYFGSSFNRDHSCPTNVAFLRTIAKYLRYSNMTADKNGNHTSDKDDYPDIPE